MGKVLLESRANLPNGSPPLDIACPGAGRKAAWADSPPFPLDRPGRAAALSAQACEEEYLELSSPSLGLGARLSG
jgi:hypothetical protein